MRLRRHAGWVAGAILSLAAGAVADQIIGQGVPPIQATIRDFKDGRIIYYLPRGDESSRPYEKIDQITVEGEDALNAAESAFAQGQKEPSVDNYIKAIRGTSKPWVKLFVARRLKDAVGDNGRFDARLAGYLALLTASPDDAPKTKPPLPEAGSKYLETAVSDVEAALKTPGLSDGQQLGLLNYMIEIQRRRGDDAAVTATLERIARLAGGKSTDPAVIAELASLKVTQAEVALEKKNYKQATSIINDVRPLLNDSKSQSDALMVIARVALATADKTDKSALNDAALGFMRVVAHFNAVEGKPNVLAAMQETAGILEQTGDKAGATTLLGQIAKEFPDDPAAAKAQQDIERLKK